MDAGGASVTATLSVVSGTLNVNAGATGVAVAGSGSNTVTLTGTLTQINDLLAGNLGATASYLINSDTPPASDTLTLSVNDGGNSGSGGAQSASASATINIGAVNDAPTATIAPASYAATEQVSLALQGTGLSDCRHGCGRWGRTATLSVVSGTLSVSAGTSGVTVLGSGGNSVLLTGTLTQINDLLAGNFGATASYLIDSDTPPASDTLTLSVDDAGNTGSGGAQSSSDTATINITAVNDAPTGAVLISGTADGRPDAHRRHQQHRRCRRVGRVQLPVGALHRWRYDLEQHRRGHREHLHAGRCRRRQPDSACASATPMDTARAESLTSAQRGPVANVNDAPTGAVDDHRHGHRRSDPDREHQQASPTPTVWAPSATSGRAPPTGARPGATSAGATAATYTLGDADVGTLDQRAA